MEAKNKGGRPRVAEKPAVLNVLVEDDVARSLKMIAVSRGVLPSVIFRDALTSYAQRHAPKE